MTTQQQGQQIDASQAQTKTRKWLTKRIVLVGIVIIVAAIVATIWILSNLQIIPGSWATIFTTIVAVLGAVFAFLQVIHSATHDSIQSAPIIVQLSPIQPPPPLFLEKTAHRGIVGFPPLADSRTIQQREHVVREVYTKLIQSDITAIALTGIGGAGKSTLASLIYRYVEEQRHTRTSLFLAETLWLTIDPAVTFADLAGNLFEALGKSLPDLGNLAPQNQAVGLFNALNNADKPRLIILDQFENLLDWDTGHALADRPGVGEWLDIINSRPCACRILLTSRPRPIGTREYPPTYLQEYAVGGLEMNEGIALLQSQGVQGTGAELQTAVSHCAGHAFSLTLLATLMRDHHMDLTTLFKDAALWSGDIATQILNQIYAQKLNDIQRELLRAFSVCREPVPLEAAQAVISEVSKGQLSLALSTLVKQHLLEPIGEGEYQLHAIIMDYAQRRFNENSEQANEEALQAAHAKAAGYYLQRAETTCPPREKRKRLDDIHDLIEAVWQYCKAGKWQEAYNLMEKDKITDTLFQSDRWRGCSILLDLYQVLLPLDRWLSERSYEADIYSTLGGICRTLGKKVEALNYYEKTLSIQKDRGERKEEGRTLNNMGKVYSDLGQKERALECYKVGLSISREVADRPGEGRALNDMGETYEELGQYKESLRCLKLGLSIYKELGNRDGESWTLNNLGKLYTKLGQMEQAQKYLEQALSIRRDLFLRRGEGRTLKNLGAIFSNLGSEKAQKYLEEALPILQDVGDRTGEGMTLNNLGRVNADLGDQKQALNYYKQALRVHKEVRNRWGEGTTLENVGLLYIEKQDYYHGLASLLLARSIFKEVQSPRLTEIQRYLEKVLNELGDEQFAALLATVEPRAQEIVDQALNIDTEQ